MNRERHPEAAAATRDRFLEQVRHAFAHDLRTPLGAIVNFATVLETLPGADGEEPRELGRRIRDNAERLDRMLHAVSTAVRLADRPLASVPTDVCALARAVIVAVGGGGVIHVDPDVPAVWSIDAEVLGFAWRAGAAAALDATGVPPSSARLALRMEGAGAIAASLSWGAAQAVEAPRADGARLASERARLERAFELELARSLVERHGGSLTPCDGSDLGAGLCVRLPGRAGEEIREWTRDP